MASIDKTAYPVFSEYFLKNANFKDYFDISSKEFDFVFENSRNPKNSLILLIFLKSYQFLGYSVPMEQVPISVQRYLWKQLKTSYKFPVLKKPSNIASYRYRRIIREFSGYIPWNLESEELAKEKIKEAAYTMSAPSDLINVAIEALSNNKYELPSFRKLDDLATSIREQVHQEIYTGTAAVLSKQECFLLDSLLIVEKQTNQSGFGKIKSSPGKNSLKQMRLWSNRLNWLDSIMTPSKYISKISHTKIRQFASQARQLELGDIKDISNSNKRYTLLLCFLHESQIKTRDELTTMFLKRIRLTHNQAKEQLKSLKEESRKWEEQIVVAFNEVVNCAVAQKKDTVFAKQVRSILELQGGAQQLSEKYKSIAAYHNNNHLPLLWGKHKAHRKAIFKLLGLMEIRSSSQDDTLLDSFSFIKEHKDSKKEFLPLDLDVNFLSKRWKTLVTTRVNASKILKRRELEICILSHMADAFRSGDLFIADSEEFADFRTQLLPWEDCQDHLKEYCNDMDLPGTAEEFVDKLQNKLHKACEKANDLFPKNTEFTIDPNGKMHLKRYRAKEKPQQLKELQSKIRESMPERHLLDMLKNVYYWSNFTKHFGPPSGNKTKMNNALSKYLYTVFGYGCNLGAAQTARHIKEDISLRTIKRINDQHITTDKLHAASVDLIDKYASFELPGFWGDGKSAAADGTHMPLIKNNLLGERHIRYGGYGGISYHHISDTYIALFSKFIGCGIWEAVYILDGLMKNNSKLQPDTIHADTQGQNEPVFGLSYLLGIKLMPRMRNWNDVTFYKVDKKDQYAHIDQVFSDVIDWNLIRAHWKDLMQVVISIKQGKVLPSMLLQKLGTHNKKNKLYRVFRELGRVIRTEFLLQYLNSKDLRRKITAATNKIESFHNFHDWITFGGTTITTGDPVEQEKRNKYLDLVANTIIFHNVVDMTNVLHKLNKNMELTPELLAHLSPYLTEHTKRFGYYTLDMDQIEKPLKMRKLKIA